MDDSREESEGSREDKDEEGDEDEDEFDDEVEDEEDARALAMRGSRLSEFPTDKLTKLIRTDTTLSSALLVWQLLR